MKICMHKGFLMAVLTRNEHCPPHVHVGSAQWEARFEFGFSHNGVRLWDVVPVHKQPTVAVLEGLRQVLKKPANLRLARECWWASSQTVCLVNQGWDVLAHEVLAPYAKRSQDTALIVSASFDVQRYCTILLLKGLSSPVEIEL